jgi:pyridoxal/pyridoxine/pyridoxamine kinase
LGPKELIITSYPGKENLKSILYLSQTMPEPVHFPYTHIPCFYTGAGDILSTLILIYTLKGHERMNAIPKAAEFIQMAISHALACNRDGSAGVLLQELIHDLQI